MQRTTCTNCGNPLREGAQFCPACGSSAVTVEPPAQAYPPSSAALSISPPQGRACVDCGNPLREGAQFCPACGSSIVTSVAPTQSHTSSSAVPVMSPPTPTARVQPDADSQSHRLPMPDSSGQPTSIPTMMPPRPKPQTATKQVGLSPDDSATSGESRLRGRPRPRRSDPRMLAAAGGLLALAVAAFLVLALGGHSSSHATGASEQATKPAAAAPAAISATSAAAATAAQPPATAAGTGTGTANSAGTVTATTANTGTANSASAGTGNTGNVGTGNTGKRSSSGGASAAVSQYWQDVNNGDYTDAVNMETSSEQSDSSTSTFQSEQPKVNVIWVKPAVASGPSRATVPVSFYARNTVGTDLICRHFSIDALMVRSGAKWLYDGAAPGSQTVDQNANGNSDCPS